MSNESISTVKSFLVQAAAGILAAAVGALVTVPEQALQLNSLALGLLSIPIFLALGAAALFLYSVYLIIRVLEGIVSHLDLFDIDGPG
jgi:hypothetical protein